MPRFLPLLLLACGCAGPHSDPDPRWLEPRTLRATLPVPAFPKDRPVRVAVYGDVQGNREAHRAVISGIRKEKPDLVIFVGDAMDCLPTGNLPDFGAATYAVPFWSQRVRGKPLVRLLSLLPFPAALHEAAPFVYGSPRAPESLNEFLEDSAPLRMKDRVPMLFVPGNHDGYHRADRENVARIFGAPDGVMGRDPEALWFAVDAGRWRIFVLDGGSDVWGAEEPLAGDSLQVRWLKASLEAAEAEKRSAIVCVHYPPYTSAREDPAKPEARALAEVLLAGPAKNPKREPGEPEPTWRVPLFLSGHAHCYERVERADARGRAVTFAVTGGAGGPFHHEGTRAAGSRALVCEKRHFLMLELDEAEIRGRLVLAGDGEEKDEFVVPAR